ncbi:MAG: hypothetical protein P5681_00410 [Limnospira sp. PMC 894.15]|uniref:hypothetical protein n=1 Tax=unclassified Limnospira TaxID=2642885 RepID=UPI0028E0D35B|nr:MULTISPECIES: hypothetical protein [unclassified Limnospira]MDT9186269.1 hypothetical protein [Limnospira sp. PMC 894.15]MDT9232133.1 hypothetical protein [Limnospira sp. PMC 917.15]
MTDIKLEQDKKRVDFIYDYTKDIISANEDSIRVSDTKLGSIIALSGAYLIVINSLPIAPASKSEIQYTCYSLITLKILVVLFLAVAIICAICGLLPKSRLGATSPSGLMKERDNSRDERELKIIVIKTWIDELEEHDRFRDTKAQWVKRSLIWLSLSAVAAVVNISLANLISML